MTRTPSKLTHHLAILCGLTLVAALTGRPACAGADDPATDKSEYQRKMTECRAQMLQQHPELSSKAQRKACKAQVGPMPEGVVPAKAPAPIR